MELTWFERREGGKKELAVRDARPPTAGHRIDTVALERCGEVYRKLLVKKDAHQPAA